MCHLSHQKDLLSSFFHNEKETNPHFDAQCELMFFSCLGLLVVLDLVSWIYYSRVET